MSTNFRISSAKLCVNTLSFSSFRANKKKSVIAFRMAAEQYKNKSSFKIAYTFTFYKSKTLKKNQHFAKNKNEFNHFSRSSLFDGIFVIFYL
jgi:hypothetical protein